MTQMEPWHDEPLHDLLAPGWHADEVAHVLAREHLAALRREGKEGLYLCSPLGECHDPPPLRAEPRVCLTRRH